MAKRLIHKGIKDAFGMYRACDEKQKEIVDEYFSTKWKDVTCPKCLKLKGEKKK